MKKIVVPLLAPIILDACPAHADYTPSDVSEAITYKVAQAPEWTALFKRSEGWFGGDSIFAIPFSGKDRGPADDSSE